MPKPSSLVSLFTGIGGLDEGLHHAGFKPLFCCELDAHAAASLENWFALRDVSPIFASDVTEVDPKNLRKTLGLKKGELDLLAGGPPCQAFSLIGKRGSLDDHRGMLLFQMPRFAKEFQPKAIMIEQVKGLLSAPGIDGSRGGALEDLVSQLEKLGYVVTAKVMRASEYGVPQHRERLIIVAMKDAEFVFPVPTHAEDKETPVRDLFGSAVEPFRTVRHAIEDLPDPVGKGEEPSIPNHIDVTPPRDRQRIKGVPEGDFLARQLHLPADQRMRLNPKKDTTKFRRLAWDLPALTLRCGEAFYHPTEDRYLTPREYMRIHGFPDDYELMGPVRGRCGSVKNLDQHRQVANAVPPTLAKIIGDATQEQLAAANAAESEAASDGQSTPLAATAST